MLHHLFKTRQTRQDVILKHLQQIESNPENLSRVLCKEEVPHLELHLVGKRSHEDHHDPPEKLLRQNHLHLLPLVQEVRQARQMLFNQLLKHFLVHEDPNQVDVVV